MSKKLHAHGKGAVSGQPKATETKAKKATLAGAAKSIGSHEVFELCIKRAESCLKLHEKAHGAQKRPEKYLSDAHRAAIVLAISALEAFVKDLLIAKICSLMADKKQEIPDPLRDQIKRFIKDDDMFDAARKDDLAQRVERAFRNELEKRTYQGPTGLEDAMKLVGYKDVLHQVALKAKANEDQLREGLEKHTRRRHSIAHRGDYDMDQNPPVEKPIKKKDAEDCIKLTKLIAKHINQIVVRHD